MREHGGRFDSAIEGDAWAVGGDSVERLGPPLVRRDSEAGDAGEVGGESGDLLREGEEGEEGLGSGGGG